MITLVEFLYPLKKSTITDKCLAVLYYEARNNNKDILAGSEIKHKLRNARMPYLVKTNVTTLLSQAGPYVDSPGYNGKGERVWKLTETGFKNIRDLLGLKADAPEIKHDVTTLENLIVNIKSVEERDYLNEALDCLKVGALRATMVFIWSTAIRNIQERCLKKGKLLNVALKRVDSRARDVSSVEDFAYIKDSTVLLSAQELKIFDKSEKETLEEALKLRNRCGHPGKYKPKEKKVSGFIEDSLSIVFKQ